MCTVRLLRPRPHLVRPPWGGHILARELAKGDDPEARVGESWEVWRENLLPDGRRLGDVADFPLLVKLLDCRETLSVQVHPDDAAALRFEGRAEGKTEGWVVLRAEPGARVAYGLRRTLDEDELRARALSGAIEEDLAWRTVAPGDVIDVPAGTIHAIGGGVMLYEVQQPTDLTYRLYDWGRPRPLHLDKAVAVARRRPCEPSATPHVVEEGREELLRTPWFVVERVAMTGVHVAAGWQALTLVEGAGTVAGEPVALGETVVLPPGTWPLAGRGAALVARTP